MNRVLISLVCCTPLLLNAPVVNSVDLIGPNSDSQRVTDQYGPTGPSETLWAISTTLRPNDRVSVYQTLVAIYKLNPAVFKNGDINKLIPRSVITIPSAEFVAQQTNKEAYRLLKTNNKPTTTKVTKKASVIPPKAAVTKKEDDIVVDPKVLTDLTGQLAEKDTALVSAAALIAEQEKELLALNEQLLAVTELNQGLKLKLQPLADQINLLGDQIEQEVTIQKELQALIEQYKAQIDNFVPPPFSGDGLLNEILRSITSSITTLLLAIISPLILLIALFVFMLRLKSKRELALQEQELAESTAILMEQSGKFDSLLTDDLDGTDPTDENIDFTEEPVVEEKSADKVESKKEEAAISEEIQQDDVNEEIELDIIDDGADIINLDGSVELDDIVVPEKEVFEELVATEDDPFGIGALSDEEDLIDELEPEEQDAIEEEFDIDALIAGTEETIELSDDDLSLDSGTDQADLDLAAEWESELASEDEQRVELDTSFEVTETESVDDIDALLEAKTANEVVDNKETVLAVQPSHASADEIDALIEAEVAESSNDVVDDIDALISAESENISTNDTDYPNDVVKDTDNAVSIDDLDDLSEFDNIDLSTLKNVDESISELDAKLETELTIESKQHTEKSVEEKAEVSAKEAPITSKNDGYIDIETLLEDTSGEEVTEDEFNLDLGLDEFPDVVESFSEFDTDDNGIAAQLDLARAYLEIDEKSGAKDILTTLLDSAKDAQLKEVQKLLERIE